MAKLCKERLKPEPAPSRQISKQVNRTLNEAGHPLDNETLHRMEGSFNIDLSAVRVHYGANAGDSASNLNARAYTAQNHIVFGSGRYQPAASGGQALLAHELTHVAQQNSALGTRPTQFQLQPADSAAEHEAALNGTRVHSGLATTVRQQLVPGTIARSVNDPNRFDTVHQNLFVDAPGTGSQTRQPWDANSATLITQQFKSAFKSEIDNRPLSVMGSVSTRTTEANAESDATRAQQRLTSRYSQIGSPLTAGQIQAAVSVLPPGQRPTLDFIKQWLENELLALTDIENFAISQSDPDFQNLVNTLASDTAPFDFTAALATLRADLTSQGWTPGQIQTVVQQQQQQVAGMTWADTIAVRAGRVGAFAEAGQKITFNAGTPASARRLTLLHELVHFFAHPDYRTWVAATTGERFYNEGFTEFLARQVMTPQELQDRDAYQERVDAIEQEVAAYVSVDDIASAFFNGEVWRIETQSTVAQRLFGSQVGLDPAASRADETTQSGTSQGIVQTLAPGVRYRFMNLGINESRPKPEHEAALQRIIADHVQNNSSARLRFVGHASSTGSATHNQTLARQRAQAFYDLARRLGVPENQLVDAGNPQTAGETTPNVTENGQVIHRALNRRVELFIQ